MEKRLFQILDEMNQNDERNNTATCGVCNHMISADMNTRGTKITMGAPRETMEGLMNRKVIPILLLIDIQEYNRIKDRDDEKESS